MKSLKVRRSDRAPRNYQCSGHGKVSADIVTAFGVSNIVFYDDRWQELGQHFGCSVIGVVDDAFVVASPCARLGQGTVVMPNAVVSADTVIGDAIKAVS